MILLVWESGHQTDGSGFEGLFGYEFKGDPDLYMTAKAYRLAGIERSYEAFQTAFGLFPAGVVPPDPEEKPTLPAGE